MRFSRLWLTSSLDQRNIKVSAQRKHRSRMTHKVPASLKYTEGRLTWLFQSLEAGPHSQQHPMNSPPAPLLSCRGTCPAGNSIVFHCRMIHIGRKFKHISIIRLMGQAERMLLMYIVKACNILILGEEFRRTFLLQDVRLLGHRCIAHGAWKFAILSYTVWHQLVRSAGQCQARSLSHITSTMQHYF